MKSTLLLSLLAFLMLLPNSESRASVGSSDLSAQPSVTHENPHISGKKQKKPGFFQKLRAIKALKKMVREQGLKGEKASKLARIALGIFAGSLLLGAFSNAVPFLSYFALAGLLVSNGLAIYILAKEEKGNSRVIARAILITTLILLVLALLLLLFLIILFASLFG